MMKTNTSKFALSLVASSLIAVPLAFAGETTTAKDITSALADSKVNINFRARYEGVEQHGTDKNARALTLKSRISIKTGAYQNVSVGIEVDKVDSLVSNYNDKLNGKAYPVVADPQSTDVNQAYIKYTKHHFSAVVGRQRVLHNNQRFVGGVGWRQNEQTYDGIRAQYQTSKLVVDYSYIHNINNIIGSHVKGDFHLVNTRYKVNKNHTFSAFSYLLDYDTALASSTSTFGGLYHGQFGPVFVNASLASQSDYADNPVNFTASYINAQVGTKLSNISVLAGYELLGSGDGVVAFKTPLATKHKFNGWADKFLITPKEGMQDVYITAKTVMKGIKLSATYHDFASDEENIDFGSELDLVAVYKINKNYGVLAKYAHYRQGDDYAKLSDTNKLWVQLTAKF